MLRTESFWTSHYISEQHRGGKVATLDTPLHLGATCGCCQWVSVAACGERRGPVTPCKGWPKFGARMSTLTLSFWPPRAGSRTGGLGGKGVTARTRKSDQKVGFPYLNLLIFNSFNLLANFLRLSISGVETVFSLGKTTFVIIRGCW